MVLTCIDGKYYVSAQNNSLEELMKEMLLAVRCLSEDVSQISGISQREVMLTFAKDISQVNIEYCS